MSLKDTEVDSPPSRRSSRVPALIPSSTTDAIAGREVVETVAPVWALAHVADSMSGTTSVSVLTAMNAAHTELLVIAEKLGADSVVGLRFEIQPPQFVIAYGTAVRTQASGGTPAPE